MMLLVASVAFIVLGQTSVPWQASREWWDAWENGSPAELG